MGAACRHAGRAIEDCFALNRRTDKASIYAGWREMDDYMRENKIEAVAPELQPRTAKKADADTANDEAPKSAQADAPAGGEKVDRVAARDAGADKVEKPSTTH